MEFAQALAASLASKDSDDAKRQALSRQEETDLRAAVKTSQISEGDRIAADKTYYAGLDSRLPSGVDVTKIDHDGQCVIHASLLCAKLNNWDVLVFSSQHQHGKRKRLAVTIHSSPP